MRIFIETQGGDGPPRIDDAYENAYAGSMSVLSRRLRETRRRLGLKQGELAQALGVTQGTISRWETGGQTPDVTAMTKLAEMAGYDPIEFALHEEEHPFRKSDWGKLVEVVGQISEGTWVEDPEWDDSQRFQTQIPTLPDWNNAHIEGFVISDDNCEPIFKKRSIVFIVKDFWENGDIWGDDYVVIERMDNRGLYEVVLRQVYINNKGETYFTTLSEDPSIGQSFKLADEKDTTIGGLEGIVKIEPAAIRGTVIASFRIETPDITLKRGR